MTRAQVLALSLAGVLAVGAAGFLGGRMSHPGSSPEAATPAIGRQVLYWYDPMYPAQRFDKPGKSPFMDMQLQPKYASEAGPGGEVASVRIEPGRTQNLGVRLAKVERRDLAGGVAATGAIDFNERDVAIVQARANGFVQKTYSRAPGDVVAAGAPLADLLVPEWSGAQGEYLAVRRTGDVALIQAARQRLQLLGMSPAIIAALERSGQVRNTVTVSTPIGGAIKTLAVRSGMTVTAGQTLAEVNGLARVWLNAAVPEALAGQVRVGQTATAALAAYPGETFVGPVTAVLPQAQAESRTLTARVELPNPGGRLKPGMFASVQFGGASQPTLLVPSEAVIRTGRRTLVMLAAPGGRYRPAEVRTGREAGGQTEVLAGLAEGEQVVASGQFLLDSEASLVGVQARPLGGTPVAAAAPRLIEGAGRVERVDGDRVTLSHGPIPAANWPAMTMDFRLANPRLGREVKRGDPVTFAFEQTPDGPVVRRLQRTGAR